MGELRARVVSIYFEVDGSIIEVQRNYITIFNDGKTPYSYSI